MGTYLRVVRSKVCTDKIPSYTTAGVDDGCTPPTKTLFNVTQNEETEEQ